MNENPTTMPMKKDTTPNANSFPPIRTTKVSSKSIPHRHHKLFPTSPTSPTSPTYSASPPPPSPPTSPPSPTYSASPTPPSSPASPTSPTFLLLLLLQPLL